MGESLGSENRRIHLWWSVRTGTRIDGLAPGFQTFCFLRKPVWFIVRPADPWGLPTPNTMIEVL